MPESTASTERSLHGSYEPPTKAPAPEDDRWVWAHRRLVVVALVASLVGGLLVLTGFRLIGPGEDVAQVKADLKKSDSVHTARETMLVDRVGSLENKMDLTTYILCVSARRYDPASAPPGCTPVVAKGAP